MSYIYFIQANAKGPVKIGFTANDPRKRIAELQTGCPWPVTLIGAIEGTANQEKQIHSVLSVWRTQGEWFKPHPVVLAAIQTAIECGKSIDIPSYSPKTAQKSKHPLSEYRARRCISMVQLASEIGCRQSALSMIESGARMPSPGMAKRIQSITGIPIEKLRPDLAQMFSEWGHA